MAQLAIDRDSESIFLSACNAIVQSSTSFEEKVRAIDVLKTSGSETALPFLEKAMHLVGVCRPTTTPRKVKGTQAIAEVSVYAAQALGRFRDGLGLSILRSHLLNRDMSRPIREAAAAGLSGLTSQAAVRLMAEGLIAGDRDVRFKVLLSARDSMEYMGDWTADHIQELLDAILAIALSKEASPREQASLEFELISLLLARYGSRRTEAQLEKVLLTFSDSWATTMALKILVRRDAHGLRKTLLTSFSRDDRPAGLYPQLASQIISQGSNGAVEVAGSVLSRYSLFRRLAYLFSVSERERRNAHSESARLVIARLGV